jgi:hypothetical protein
MTISPKKSFAEEAIGFGYLAGTRIAHIAQLFRVSHGSCLPRVKMLYWHHACVQRDEDQMTGLAGFPFHLPATRGVDALGYTTSPL